MATRKEQVNNQLSSSSESLLKGLQKKIILRTALVVITLVLTAVLVFSLTVAWQTNVVQTGGLTFTAESWGFSGEITVSEQAFTVAPGDSGTVTMQFSNQSDYPAAAGLTVDKSGLVADMQKRMFFYVDGSTVRNGETVERVYVSKKSSFTYTLFPNSTLVLDGQSYNSPTLKWEWVYDNLGYYVLGTRTENGGVIIEDYLRPIEYAYDPMRTTFDAGGALVTVDGSATVEELLAAISLTDGYESDVNYAEKTAAGYYPVEVNSKGYGVWAYLCTYQEIADGAAADTALGNDNAALGNVTVSVVGYNSREEGQAIADEAELNAALATPGVSIVKLTNDLSLTGTVSAAEGDMIMIDLDGHKLTSSAETIISAAPGGEVLVCNGHIDGLGNTGTAVSSTGGKVTLKGVTVDNVGEGVTVFDNKNSLGADSLVYLTDCSITAFEDGLWIYGNAGASEQNTIVVAENCYIEGTNYAGIICNGTYYGTDITVRGCTVKGKYTAVYFPQKDSIINIESSTLEGYTGLVAKGGTINILDSTVMGTGAYTPLPDSYTDLPLSGWTDTGDGVYLEANYTTWSTVINISGSGTVIGCADENALAVRQYPDSSISPLASVSISGGSFSTDVRDYLAEGYTISETTDGTGTTYTALPKE